MTGTVRAAQTAAVTAIGAVGALYAIPEARALYNVRGAMAALFQQETIFPRDLVQDNRSFYMSFKFQAYEKRAINNSPFLRSMGTIRLPIPDNLRDNTSVSYGPASISTAVGAGLESLAGAGPVTGFQEGASAVAGAAGATAAGLVAQRAFGSELGQAASALTGIAVNPYQTILFEKPEFKSHQFSWKFMPRDEQETLAARDIIRTFQYHMLPGVSDNIGLFFSYPSTVVVSLYPSSEFLYRFKPCVIKSVNVNYAGGSSPSFFKRSAAPTVITMSIDMQEIEYWTNKDYTAESFSDAIQLQNFAMRNMARPTNNSPLYS